MKMWKIVWTDSKEAHVKCVPSEDDVLDLVKLLHANERSVRPVVEVMKWPSEIPSLSIAVGGEETVLTFEESSSPPHHISLGESLREGTSPMFIHGGQGIDHLARNLVPWNLGFKGLSQFLKTEKRPDAIDWERL
jgi:hypothetical protein